MKRLLILSLFLMACDDHKFSGGHSSHDTVDGSGYEAVQAILNNSCVGCHSQSGTFPALDGDLCADIVGVESSVSGVLQIEAGSAENSYLIHKINNTHTDVGGTGSQMPFGTPLTEDEVTVLTDWINDGAVCDENAQPEPTSEPTSEATSEPTSDPTASTGQEVHDAMCIGCHSGGPSLAVFVPTKTDEELEDIIINGYGAMPAQNVLFS